MKTCGYCHKIASSCAGDGIAKNCKENGGKKIDLATHMKALWEKIGFSPTGFQLQDLTEEEQAESDRVIKATDKFNPPLKRPEIKEKDIEKITGLEISNLPASKTDEEIKAFVEEKLESEINEISFKRKNKKVAVKIDTRNKVKGEKILEVVQQIQFISSKEKIFGNPLYCRVLKDLTPVKEPEMTTQCITY